MTNLLDAIPVDALKKAYVVVGEILVKAGPNVNTEVVGRAVANTELLVSTTYSRLDHRGNMWVQVVAPFSGYAISHNKKTGNVFLGDKPNSKNVVAASATRVGRWTIDGKQFVTPSGERLGQMVGAYSYISIANTNAIKDLVLDAEVMASVGMKVVGVDCYLPYFEPDEAAQLVLEAINAVESLGMYVLLMMGGLVTHDPMDSNIPDVSVDYWNGVLSRVANHPAVIAIQTPLLHRNTERPSLTAARALHGVMGRFIDIIRKYNPQAITVPGWVDFTRIVPADFLHNNWLQVMYRLSYYGSFFTDFGDNVDVIDTDMNHSSIKHLPSIVAISRNLSEENADEQLAEAMTHWMTAGVPLIMCPMFTTKPLPAIAGNESSLNFVLNPALPNYGKVLEVWNALSESIKQNFK